MTGIGRESCVMGWVLFTATAPCAAWAATTPAVPRIVSLSPHITELLFAAGAGLRVVGVDSASDYPPAAMQIPRLGEAASLDVEKLLELAPTLVIAWQSGTPPRARAELDRLHVPVLLTEQRSLDDIAKAIEHFGALAGTPSVATAAALRYRADLAALRTRFADRPRLRVFYQVWDRPLYTLSADHVVSEVLSLCGGDNIFSDLKLLAPAVDRETVLARDPDVILIGAVGAQGEREAADWQRFSAARAVHDRHVFLVDPSLIGRMAPRILEGVRAVCRALEYARNDGSRLQ